MEITTVYQKERADFGRATHSFADTEVVILDEFLPEEGKRSEYIERNPTVLDIQAIADLSAVEVSGRPATDGSYTSRSSLSNPH